VRGAGSEGKRERERERERERGGAATRSTGTPLDARPYFCIALFSAAAFLVDFIINYLNAFDSRKPCRVPRCLFLGFPR